MFPDVYQDSVILSGFLEHLALSYLVPVRGRGEVVQEVCQGWRQAAVVLRGHDHEPETQSRTAERIDPKMITHP